MTIEQKRIKLAKADGEDNDSIVRGLIPDYFNDLNAVHELEKVLKEKKLFFKYHLLLSSLPQLQGNNHLNIFHATAEQRAEAFGLTLGLWEASK